MKKEKRDWYARIILVVLIITLIILGYSLWRQYRHIQLGQAASARRTELSNILHRHPLTADDTSYIETWMTFDYIAAIYRVPAPYLQQNLSINSLQFPKISIARYARNSNIDPAVLKNSVIESVKSYLNKELTATTTPQ